ncbi:MAG: Shikimate dehydrogenase [Parcubacteria group bacterium GW2011_GWA2_51_10]|nr:MAG: Shikimate dehydrogenase [Parcubacteria group bacterium GW2011_GWA2_51_10]
MSITPATKLTAVFGYPVGQSLSPLLHNEIYAREGVDAVMLAFENPDIEKLVAAVRALPIHLTAVTIPHKEKIMPLLDEIDTVAREIGSVNTVINENGKLKGFNTDVIGVAVALSGLPLNGKNVLLLGAGGAARAIAYHLKKEGASIFCFDRTFAKAEALCRAFEGEVLKEVNESGAAFDVIINATPVGMLPNVDDSPIAKEIIRPDAIVFDLIYKPRETRLLREAKERGAKTISGIVMFLAQALQQERLWLKREISDAEYVNLLG